MEDPTPTRQTLKDAQERISTQARALLFLAALESSTSLELPENAFNEYPGLQAIQLVRNSTGDLLITYWANANDFEINREVLAQRLGVQLAYSGGVGRLQTPPTPRWRQVTPLGILLAVSGALGAAQICYNHYEKVFAPPAMGIAFEKAEEQNVLQGAPFGVNAVVENFLSAVDHRDLKVEASLHPQLSNGTASTLPVSSTSFVSLGAGKTHAVGIAGKAPAPGQYKLEVVVSGEAGLLRGRNSFRTEVPLRSWPMDPRPLPLRVGQRHFGPTVVAQVEIGRDAPAGIECAVDLLPLKPASLNWWLSQPQETDHEIFGTDVVVVKWRWPKGSARSVLTAEWSLKGFSASDLQDLIGKAKAECIDLGAK
jgi:hypothetical protein